MRTALIWTLSILLGFEPALFAAGKNPNSEIKAFLETSQITQRSMTIKDLFAKTSASLPESVRVDLETFVSKQGNVLIPKFDVNKVSGPNGEGLYQIQAVQDGQAISMTFVLGKEVFMKVNGTNYTWNEMNDVRQVMAKAGLGPKEIQENFPSRKPANAAKFLSADQILKLNPEQKKLYFKQFRDLLESMEAVENALSNKTTSSRENGRAKTFAQQMVQLFLGEEVNADEVKASLEKSGYSYVINNIVLTGGTSSFIGIEKIAAKIFDKRL